MKIKWLDWFMAIPLVAVFIGVLLVLVTLIYQAYTDGKYGFLVFVFIVVWSCLSWAYFTEVDDEE